MRAIAGRPNLHARIVVRPSLRYHGGPRPLTLGAVWHETDSTRWTGSGGTEEYLNSGQKEASYHYAITFDGTIYRVVDPDLIGYHAGVKCTAGPPAWRERSGVLTESVNGRTLGIAWVNRVARGHPLTAKQLESGLWLGTVMQQRYGYPPAMNCAHREVAPAWKSDPLAEHLDMEHWRQLLGSAEWPDAIAPRPLVAA